MTRYLVWFRGNRNRTEAIIVASSRTEAVAIFAKRHNCQPSSYIAIRAA